MKDVTVMLKEISHENEDCEKTNILGKGPVTNPKAAVHCSSPSSLDTYQYHMLQTDALDT